MVKKHIEKYSFRDIIKDSYFHLLGIFILLIFLLKVGVLGKYSFNFAYLAIILGFFGITLYTSKEKIKIPKYFLYIALAIILLLRLIPFFSTLVPLGYDPGLYKYSFEQPFAQDWTAQANPLLFSLVFYVLNLILGSWFILTIFLALLSTLVGWLIYYVISKKFNSEVGVMAILIYMVSIASFQAFWWNYLKNICGICLLLISYLYFQDNKRINWKLILIGGLIAGFHRPAFLIFGLSYFIYVLLDIKKFKSKEFRNSVINGMLIVILGLLFNIDRIFTFLLPGVLMTAKSVLEGSGGSGTFFSLKDYFYYTIPFIPFAITGFIKYFKKNIPIALGGLITSCIVLFGLFFHNRFIIYLDIFVVIYSALGFYSLIQNKEKYGKILFYSFIALFLVLIVIHSFNSKALISDEEFAKIKTFDYILPSDAVVMSISSSYSPWLKGYVHREVIAPGLFDNNPWDKSEWETFWNDEALRVEMLNELNISSLYIYQGDRMVKYKWNGNYSEVIDGLYLFD
ncbi:MAG: hypothetical protein AB7V77_05630 [Candidatus Woesearchaeota archaeon]